MEIDQDENSYILRIREICPFRNQMSYQGVFNPSAATSLDGAHQVIITNTALRNKMQYAELCLPIEWGNHNSRTN